jgi:hypothetical protein
MIWTSEFADGLKKRAIENINLSPPSLLKSCTTQQLEVLSIYASFFFLERKSVTNTVKIWKKIKKNIFSLNYKGNKA